jgi:hypothetical protein
LHGIVTIIIIIILIILIHESLDQLELSLILIFPMHHRVNHLNMRGRHKALEWSLGVRIVVVIITPVNLWLVLHFSKVVFDGILLILNVVLEFVKLAIIQILIAIVILDFLDVVLSIRLWVELFMRHSFLELFIKEFLLTLISFNHFISLLVYNILSS